MKKPIFQSSAHRLITKKVNNMQKFTTREHYNAFKDKAIRYHVLWQDDKFCGYTKDQWIEMSNQDPHLNQLGNPFFDKYFHMFHSPEILSLSDNICALKHYINYYVINAKPNFMD